MTKLKVDPLTRRKNVWYITDILRGFNIVDSNNTVPFNAFYIPDHSIFGGQYSDIRGLATTFRE
jgi:hypothetical protein